MGTAITDAYAIAGEYRARVGKSDTAADALLDEVLVGVSRRIDRECGRFFTKDATAVARVYDGNGLTRLYVDDLSAAPTAVKVDRNADYDYADADETLTEGIHFWIGPLNADKGPEVRPYRYLDIVPGNSVLTYWPDQTRAVQVTAKFGWPSVPMAIKDAAVLMAREVLELQRSGFTLSLQNVDDAINLAPQAMSILGRIKRDYGLHGKAFV